MTGYLDDPALTAAATRGGYFHSGDVASRDAEGYITYVGRTDDLFKASDYLISPFELENVLVEHEAVTEAAVVPSPDTIRLAVPKAYVALTAGWEPTADTASPSSSTPGTGSLPTSASGGSSSPICRRRSQGRSAESSCATWRSRATAQPRHQAPTRPRRILGGGLPPSQGLKPGAARRAANCRDHYLWPLLGGDGGHNQPAPDVRTGRVCAGGRNPAL